MAHPLSIYLDNHATTQVDPRVVEAMLPYLSQRYGNAASTSHRFGWEAKQAVESARESIAQALGARPGEIVFTSGATESNNLAIRGVTEQKTPPEAHLISVVAEHPAVLDPLRQLKDRGYQVTLLPVRQAPDRRAGLVEPEQVEAALRDNTVLVSVMLANNEIGALQPLEQIGSICRQRGVLLHTDATQAVGKIPIDVEQLGVDLLSFSAHKMHGPKGIGALYVRRRPSRVRLQPQIRGGGQERGLRSGTLNVAGIVAMAKALEYCLEDLDGQTAKLAELRNRLFEGLTHSLEGVELNGPALDEPGLRLAGNLNVRFAHVDGESLLMSTPTVAASSGSACSSSRPGPSHVLLALGHSQQEARSSVRFGLSRFNTPQEIDRAVAAIVESVLRLRRMVGRDHPAAIFDPPGGRRQ